MTKRTLAFVLAAVSCGGPAAPVDPTAAATPIVEVEVAPPSPPASKANAAIVDVRAALDPATKPPMSAYLGRRRAPSWRADGAPLGDVDAVLNDPEETDVFEETSRALRIRVVDDEVVFLLWIRLGDFEPQLQRLSIVRPEPDAPAPPPGYIEVAPAEPIRLLERREPACRIGAYRSVKLEGWVPCDALGPIVKKIYLPDQSADATVPDGVLFQDRKGGEELWGPSDPSGADGHLVDVIERKDGWSKVQYVVPCTAIRVTGFVSDTFLETTEPEDMNVGCLGLAGSGETASWGGLASAPRTPIAAETDLYDGGGHLVGRTRMQIESAVDPKGDRFILTEWGPLPVRTEP